MARTKVQTDMIDYAGTAIDRRKNYVVNPSHRVSQENGTSGATTSGYYVADQWSVSHSHDGTLTSTSTVDGNGVYSISSTVTSADSSLAAGQFATFRQTLEGLRVVDLGFGTAAAKQVVIAFDWYSTLAGTYAVSLKNAASNRSYVAEFTVAGGETSTWVRRTVVIPGDTSGTWPTGAVAGMILDFTMATGPTFQTTAGAWQAGSYIGTSSTTNGLGTGSAVHGLRNVGMYADPDETGVAPPFTHNHIAADLLDCKRYYQKVDVTEMMHSIDTVAVTYFFAHPFKVEMRAAPTVSLTSNMTGFGSPSVGAVTAKGMRVDATASGTASGRIFSVSATVSARM